MINSTHPEYDEMLDIWTQCDDFTSGSRAVKGKREKYLPRPNPDDYSLEAHQRYENYLRRAVFYGFSSNEVNKYLGLAFKQDPVFEPVKELEYLKTNANGAGTSIYQLAQNGFKSLMVNGRFGLWVDYTKTNLPRDEYGNVKKLSRTERQKLGVHGEARILFYHAENIINWIAEQNGKIIKIILKESSYQVGDDGYKVSKVERYRELGLDQNGFYIKLWKKDGGNFTLVEYSEPTDYDGKRLQFIPFVIFGSQFNTFDKQQIPIEPLVHIEHGIYCNSADAENSSFICGQIQPFMNIDNQTADYYNRVDENGNKVNNLRLGSETVIMLGENGHFGFAQAQPNTMATQGIIDKREIISELGYQLGQAGTGIKTATQADNEAQAQHSKASLCVANINEGFHQALLYCHMFVGVNAKSKFVIKQQFSPINVDANILSVLSNLIDGGKLPKSVLWNKAKEFNLLDPELNDDEITGMIEADGLSYETLDKS